MNRCYKIHHFALIFLLFGSYISIAQDIHFSQIQEAPLLLNPANTAFFNGYYRAIANYRTQWASMGNPYKTMAVSFDARTVSLKKQNGFIGVGLYVFNDKSGNADISATQGMLCVSGNVRVSETSKAAVGIYNGFSQNTANYNKLTFGTQFNGTKIDAALPTGENVSFQPYSYYDAGIGANYEYSNTNVDMARDDVFSIKIGAAAYHLNRPVLNMSSGSSYKLPMRIVGQVSSRIDVTETKLSVLPSVIYMQQSKANEIVVGTHLRYRLKNGTKITGNKSESGISLGAYWRVKDAIVPQLMLDVGDYSLGFSYDYNLSSYTQVSRGNGGFELFLKWISWADALYKRR